MIHVGPNVSNRLPGGSLSCMFYWIPCQPDSVDESPLHVLQNPVDPPLIQIMCAEEKPLKHAGEWPPRTRTEHF